MCSSETCHPFLTVCLICAFCFPVVLRLPTLTRVRITVLLAIKPLSSLFRCLSNLDLFKLTKLFAWLNLGQDLDGQLWESEQFDSIIFLSWLRNLHSPTPITSATTNPSISKLVSAEGYRLKSTPAIPFLSQLYLKMNKYDKYNKIIWWHINSESQW